ncbi:LacI family DNA-binding transcriptional regulator [Latilactobacillus curvatus]|uniref:LacI family DNA-binding transcriptional regulator n=1 Tax=Latilactobacillus curvatus TaxID=28038 RepID=UPI000F7CF43F|nr:LacI family DNA-binding transcriptional regulator [Latilactobacillus curvatus]AZP95671.1 LacI family transcriptional regulator [Latilactobacillus curvatus]MBZ1505229.1 LacI family DNA-binding transcriptional regulator [Latilactobacillus curvatus]MCT3532907.1 LacI family transcriptional regulator [Latilactobacillus curvatus]UTC15103.1 hypothetical protein A4W80_09780 [Latilactobacillus curvatus]
MTKKYSIKDVAKLSKVSVATVSRVINNNGRFSEETRQRVLDAIAELNYEQNKLAVSLRKNKSNTIGILVPDITNEFYSAVVKKCEQNLFAAGFSSIVCNTERSLSREQNYLKVLSEHMVDGLIIISANDHAEESLSIRVPVVYIDRNPHLKDEFIITSDHYTGAQKATEFLIKRHYSPFIITTKTNSSATVERIKGFKDTLFNYNIIDSAQERVIQLNMTSDQYLLENKELDSFISSIKPQLTERRIGVFAINDYIAFMVARAAIKQGLSIPDELSIIGFDDAPVSLISTPSISTVQQDTGTLAQRACRLITKQLTSTNTKLTKRIELIPVKLILRSSTPK